MQMLDKTQLYGHQQLVPIQVNCRWTEIQSRRLFIKFPISLFCDLATTTATPLQPPQIVNPVLGGQDVRNVAGNQMDIRNADPRDIRISNGYVETNHT